MGSKLRAIVRTARALMSKGLIGTDLAEAIQENYPNLSPIERRLLTARLKKEIGILGQVAHDPNLFQSCQKAKLAKERHPHVQTLIATYRTPMCATCSWNRKGNCALMGGRLVGGPQSIPESIATKTASILVEEEQISEREAKKILSADLAPGKRAAALHLRKSLPVLNDAASVSAQAQSRRLSSILYNETKSFVQSVNRTGPRRERNSDSLDQQATLAIQPGDEIVSRRVASLEKVMQTPDFYIDVSGAPQSPRKDVRVSARSPFDLPKPVGKLPKSIAAASDNDAVFMQEQCNQLIAGAAKTLARGDMTAKIAEEMGETLRELQQNGARISQQGQKIVRQLSSMTGGLELEV